MTIREMRTWLAADLEAAVGADEAKAIADAILQDVKGYTAVDLALYGHRELLAETEERMRAIAKRVKDGEPLQYAIGKAYFHGRMYGVDTSTLIPRPETSQLVDMVADDYRNSRDARLLDIGTGSGCIAISLALDIRYSQVTAIDISPGALQMAESNAKALSAKVRFVQADALNLQTSPLRNATYDAIVSNPPYVLASERKSMDKRVTDYEPPTALFVPDSDPLIFYRAIAQYAQYALSDGGKLYFEINPLCADELRKMLARTFDRVDIIKDYKGNNRFAICTK